MKKFRFFSFVVLSTLLLPLWDAPSHAQAPEFLGDYCWSFVTDDGAAGILRLGVTDITDFISTDHFLLTGVFTTTAPSIAESPITGNGELLSDGFHATLTSSRFDGPGITRSVIHLYLNANTLEGFFDEAPTYIDADLAFANTPDSGYRRGSVSLIVCP